MCIRDSTHTHDLIKQFRDVVHEVIKLNADISVCEYYALR